MRHLMSMNFSAPRSAPNPASVTTKSASFRAVRVAVTLLQPCAMFAKGPPWTNAKLFSSVWTRLGLMASFSSAAIAPSALRSRARTGSRFLVKPTTISPSRVLRSLNESARHKIAMTSEAAVISKPSSRV